MTPHYVDNFLSNEDLQIVKNIVLDESFAWYWNDKVYEDTKLLNNTKNFYFSHLLYLNEPKSDFYYKIVDFFWEKLEIKSLSRIKANCYPNNIFFEHGYHFDRPYPHKGAIFCLNTCDGYTKFKSGEKIDSVENRIIFFNPGEYHTSTNTSNTKRRVNLNFNYF
jgi:hypothetical protein